MKRKILVWTSAVALAFLIFPIIGSATVTELNVTPDVVLQGEKVKVCGKASPNEDVWLGASFEISTPVSEGRYHEEFKGIEIPKGEKTISVTAENVKNIRISIYPVFVFWFWQTIEYPLEGPLNAMNGTATISVSFPADFYGKPRDIHGAKDIKVYGDALEGADAVHLIVKTSIKVTADSEGRFELEVSTKGVPPGEFRINAGGEEKKVRIFLNGDVNADGVIDSADYMHIARWIAGMEGYDLEEKVADVSGDGIVDAYDCVYLARYIAGISGYEELK